jgi:Phage integrase, N-terminal SAM-like domain
MAITKRGENVYLVRVYVGRDRVTGKRIEVNETVHGDFEEAQRKEQILKSRAERGRIVKPARMTVKQLFDFYLETTRHRREEGHQVHLKYTFDKYVIPYIGSYQIKTITASDIQRLLNYLMDPKKGKNDDEEERRD